MVAIARAGRPAVRRAAGRARTAGTAPFPPPPRKRRVPAMSTDWLWECGTTSVREPVRWSGRAEPSAVAVVRRLVGDEAVRAGGDEDVRDRLRLAVTEAVTNVVMHAYRFASEPGDVLVTVEHH